MERPQNQEERNQGRKEERVLIKDKNYSGDHKLLEQLLGQKLFNDPAGLTEGERIEKRGEGKE